jgi:hypothetical protein
MITNAQKIGRNEACPCGSNKKFKYCCGSVVKHKEEPNKQLSPSGFLKVMQKMIVDAGGTFVISCEDMENLPKDEAINSHYDKETDSFTLTLIKIEKKTIIQPDNKVRVPLIKEN